MMKCKQVSETPLICMLIKVEQKDETVLPSFLFAPDLISMLCKDDTGTKPERVNPLNGFEAILEFPFGTVVTGIAMALCSVGIWYAQDIKINCTMMHQLKVSFPYQSLSHEKTINGQPELNIQGHDIDSPSREESTIEQNDQLEKAIKQMSAKLINYMAEQVCRLESMV